MDPERVEVRRVDDEHEEPQDGPPEPSNAGCGMLLLKWVLSAVVIYLVAELLEPNVAVSGIGTALIVAAVLGFLNVVLKPLLLILTLPITLITFGLFLLVINAIILALASVLVPGFDIEHFGWALLAAALISLANLLVDRFLNGLAGPTSES